VSVKRKLIKKQGLGVFSKGCDSTGGATDIVNRKVLVNGRTPPLSEWWRRTFASLTKPEILSHPGWGRIPVLKRILPKIVRHQWTDATNEFTYTGSIAGTW